MLNLWYLSERIGWVKKKSERIAKIIRNKILLINDVNELNTIFTYEILWYCLGIYNQVNKFKTKLNPLIKA
jgi:hypothetical protein